MMYQKWMGFEEFATGLFRAKTKQDFIDVRKIWLQLCSSIAVYLRVSGPGHDTELFLTITHDNHLVWPRGDEVCGRVDSV